MLKSMFSSSQDVSMMRVCQFICTLTATAATILCILWGRDLGQSAALIASILTPAFIGKAAQSFAEPSGGKNDSTPK